MFDLKAGDPHKQLRFRRPEFQEKLARARRYQRKVVVGEEGGRSKFFQKIGLRSNSSRIGAGIFLLLIAYFLFISRIFLVKHAEVVASGVGEAEVSEVLQRMEYQQIFLIPSNHILIFSQKRFLAALQKELPEIRRLSSFKRLFPDKVRVALEKREPLYVWQSGENYYLLDQDGVVFQKITNYQPAAFTQTLISDRTRREVKVGEELPIQTILHFVQETQRLWEKFVPQTSLVSFSVPGIKSLDIFAKTAIGFEVYFDLERKAETELKNLNLVLAQEIKAETYSGLSYIDLRLPTMVYYCYQDAPCALENESSKTNP